MTARQSPRDDQSASDVRDSQQSSDMVERVARAICIGDGYDPDEACYGDLGETAGLRWQGWKSNAERALEASHHVELVEALRNARATFDILRQAVPGWRREACLSHEEIQHIDTVLAKIGGEA